MALILHGTYLIDKGRFAFWAERDSLSPHYKRRKTPPLKHPFAATTAEISERLPFVQPQPAELVLWLPSDDERPQPSPECIEQGVPFETVQNPVLKSWLVEAVTVPVSEAVDLLLAHQDYGHDLHYWRNVTLQTLALIARQQVIPGLRRDGFQLYAYWQLHGDTENLSRLIQRMPPICRANVEEVSQALPPAKLQQAFVDRVVDESIREATPSFPISRSRTAGSRWIAALTCSDRRLALQGADAEALFKSWQTWIGQADVAGNAAFRVAFRLNAPEDADGDWKLEYLLQATDDPSLILSAGQIWRGYDDAYLQQRFDQPQERLLTALGFAARLFPPIHASLKTAAPEQTVFGREEAYTFLSDVAPLLQSSGFRVLLPRWWGRKTARLSAKASAKSQSPTAAKLTLSSLLNVNWELMLGGQPISREEFEQLAALKQPLVFLRGQWVTIDQDQITAGLKFLQQPQEQLRLGEMLQWLLNEEGKVNGIDLQGVEIEDWIREILNKLQTPDQLEILPTPDDLKAELRPYQQRGFSWLFFLSQYSMGACLADDMGLGKTIQAIALLLSRQYAPTLLVCPTSVIGNWRRELARFAPTLSVTVHQGAERLSGEDFINQTRDCDLIITSYPLLARDSETLTAVDWEMVILDEAQNIKNSSAKQAQAARALKTQHRIALTGTPVENRLSELWSIFQFINPGYLGSESSFRKKFVRPIERLNDPDVAKRLKQLTAPFILRRLKTDPTIIQDLPEKMEMKVYCNLTTEQGTLYEAVVQNTLQQIQEADEEGNSMARRGLVLSLLMQLKQVCNHPAQYLKDGSPLDDRSGKLARLTEMLEEVYAAGDRALIFTQFAEMGELLRTHFRNVFYDEPLWLYGGTSVKERDKMITRFQAVKGPTVFILSIKAGGVGLNLTRANHVFHFDRWWNPAVENQATDRAFRIGQTRNVQVHKFISVGTLEEKIDDMIESKRALAERIIGADESWLTELDTAALYDLVKLREG